MRDNRSGGIMTTDDIIGSVKRAVVNSRATLTERPDYARSDQNSSARRDGGSKRRMRHLIQE